MIELRTYVFIDSLQPQLAELMASVSQGFPPVPGDSCLWVEVAPGMAVHRVTDITLKTTQVKLTQQVVERAFGSMVIHSRSQADVRQAGEILLSTPAPRTFANAARQPMAGVRPVICLPTASKEMMYAPINGLANTP